MGKASIRVLVVDDYGRWRRYFSTALRNQQGLEVIGEVSDGLDAVQKVDELRPDLILLDIGLPTLNGIEVARRIRKVSPTSKILFVSDDRSADIVEEALSTGAGGYVVKSDAARDLLPAVNAVLEGKRFLSASVAGYGLPPNQHAVDHPRCDSVVTFNSPQNLGIARHHEVGFYSEDRYFLDDVTRFIGTTLKAGNAAIVVATESHRESLLPRLQAYGVDIGAAVAQGRYIALDAGAALTAFMLNGMPDPVRYFQLLGDLLATAAEAVKGGQSPVSIFGECVHILWTQGNAEAAIQLEKLANRLAKTHDLDILWAFFEQSSGRDGESDIPTNLCRTHSRSFTLRIFSSRCSPSGTLRAVL